MGNASSDDSHHQSWESSSLSARQWESPPPPSSSKSNWNASVGLSNGGVSGTVTHTDGDVSMYGKGTYGGWTGVSGGVGLNF